ncbi:hypothetical protein RRG08_013138 [Elysia crispata]|uniref:Uncharacterized protein n=1 Tax=Elysia crispata TaxID=231223 RepID=A0AAE1DQ84_9GAST|nr:hypothetical protein RRG08_013138 [Elysia crispata]
MQIPDVISPVHLDATVIAFEALVHKYFSLNLSRAVNLEDKTLNITVLPKDKGLSNHKKTSSSKKSILIMTVHHVTLISLYETLETQIGIFSTVIKSELAKDMADVCLSLNLILPN